MSSWEEVWQLPLHCDEYGVMDIMEYVRDMAFSASMDKINKECESLINFLKEMDNCGDNRFELIDRAKKELLRYTNIESSEEEMKVLDSFLQRCWQMGWLNARDDVRFIELTEPNVAMIVKMADAVLEETPKKDLLNMGKDGYFEEVLRRVQAWRKLILQNDKKDGSKC